MNSSMHRVMVCASVLMICLAVRSAFAQDEASDLTLPTNRALEQRFRDARNLIDEEKYNDVTRFLGEILAVDDTIPGDQDAFYVPERGDANPRGLKAEAIRLLGDLPEKGRAFYELQFGVRARKLLDEAVHSGSTARLAEVSRRYFHTQAGYQATMLLARRELDQGRPLAAAYMLQKLLRYEAAASALDPALSVMAALGWLQADQPARAREVLQALQLRMPAGQVTLAGRPQTVDAGALFAHLRRVTMASKRPASNRQDDWTMHRGDPGRNAQSNGSMPLLAPRWQVPVAADRAADEVLRGRHDYYGREGVPILPGLQPLAVGDQVVMRSARYLWGVDFQTGKRLWRVGAATDDGFAELVGESQAEVVGRARLADGLEKRVWDDAVYGHVSSDGERVYAIQDLHLQVGEAIRPGLFISSEDEADEPPVTNRLEALDLVQQGKRVWSIGGSDGPQEFREAFFLGPPLPLDGRLYVMAEMRGNIRLVALDAETGDVEWTQVLARVEFSVSQNRTRRLAGAAPSFADGVLVCPTAAGAVVAVDLTTRSLLWAYEYPLRDPERFLYPGAFSTFYDYSEERENDRWLDGAVTIVGDRVVLTPVESDKLICLNLLDGSLAWEPASRGKSLFLACVHEGKIILVRDRYVSAVGLEDGRTGWPHGSLRLPDDAIPSGRGFYSGASYYLPLTTGEIVQIDLDEGRIAGSVRAAGETALGNLVCHRGAILSQSGQALVKFPQRAPLETWINETLAREPNHPEAILRKGQLAAYDGERETAVNLFRQALREAQQHEAVAVAREARAELVAGLHEGLRSDFAAYRDALPELDELIVTSDERVAFLRIKALGLNAEGEIAEAALACLELIDRGRNAAGVLESIAPDHQARGDRWLWGQLADLYDAADASDRARIDELVAAQLDEILTIRDETGVRQALDWFDWHPATIELRLDLVRLLLKEKRFLEAGLLLADLDDLDADVRNDDARDLRKQLHAQLGSVHPVDQPAPRWPHGQVAASESRTPRELRPDLQPVVPLDVVRDGSQALEHHSFALDQNSPALLIYDGLGHEHTRIPLAGENSAGHDLEIMADVHQARLRGHFLMLSLGYDLMAIDLSGNASSRGVLWSRNLAETAPGIDNDMVMIHTRRQRVPGGITRARAQDERGNPIGGLGPLTEHGVVFQQDADLYCVDILTGETQWVRRDMPLGCELFGDREVLLVAPPRSEDAIVLRTADGTLLGRCKLQREARRVVTHGRNTLSVASFGGAFALAYQDPWREEAIWRQSFDAGTMLDLIGREAVAALEPSGRFVLLALETGEVLLEHQLEPETRLANIHVVATATQYFLFAAHRFTADEQELHIARVPDDDNFTYSFLLTGRIYAFDRATGRQQWQSPATIDQRSLRLPQHAHLPVLALVQTLSDPDEGGDDSHASVLLIDRRSGRPVYQNDGLRMTPRLNFDYRLEGDPEANQLTLTLPEITLKFTLTGRPVPPEPPVQSSQPAPEKKKGIFGIIFGAFGEKQPRERGQHDHLGHDHDGEDNDDLPGLFPEDLESIEGEEEE